MLLHHAFMSMAICSAPPRGSGRYVATTQTQAAHQRYTDYHALRAYLRCQKLAGIPQGPIY